MNHCPLLIVLIFAAVLCPAAQAQGNVTGQAVEAASDTAVSLTVDNAALLYCKSFAALYQTAISYGGITGVEVPVSSGLLKGRCFVIDAARFNAYTDGKKVDISGGDGFIVTGTVETGPSMEKITDEAMLAEVRKVINEGLILYADAHASAQTTGKKAVAVDSPEDAELKRACRLYMEEHPAPLRGTYSGAIKYMLNTFITSYTFEDGRMRFEGKNTRIGKPLTVEGRMMYNENKIVLIPEKGTWDGQAVDSFDREPIFVWDYTLKDRTLELKGGRKFKHGAFIWQNNGAFTKTE
jgi:hypothetical protein